MKRCDLAYASDHPAASSCSFKHPALVFVPTLAISTEWWILVEKPGLKLKRQSLKPIDLGQGYISQRLIGENAS